MSRKRSWPASMAPCVGQLLASAHLGPILSDKERLTKAFNEAVRRARCMQQLIRLLGRSPRGWGGAVFDGGHRLVGPVSCALEEWRPEHSRTKDGHKYAGGAASGRKYYSEVSPP